MSEMYKNKRENEGARAYRVCRGYGGEGVETAQKREYEIVPCVEFPRVCALILVSVDCLAFGEEQTKQKN